MVVTAVVVIVALVVELVIALVVALVTALVVALIIAALTRFHSFRHPSHSLHFLNYTPASLIYFIGQCLHGI